MKFEYREISGGFLTSLSYTKQKISTKDVGKDLSDIKSSIFKLLENNHKITIPQIAYKLGVTTRTIVRNIDKLKKEHILIRIGGRKTGYWKIIDDL